MHVMRVGGVAELDERLRSADRARARAAAGDAENARLLEDWEAGALLLATVTVSVNVRDADGEEVGASRVLDGVWLERMDPAAVERQVADVAPSELPALARELTERGVAVDAGALDAAYLHVELGPRLRGALSLRAAAR
jgi:hypothetical protein